MLLSVRPLRAGDEFVRECQGGVIRQIVSEDAILVETKDHDHALHAGSVAASLRELGWTVTKPQRKGTK